MLIYCVINAIIFSCSELQDILLTTCAAFVNVFPFVVAGILQAQFLTYVNGVLMRFEAINRYELCYFFHIEQHRNS